MTKESFTMWSVICTVLMIWCVFSAIRLAYKVIRSRKMLREIRAENETVIHGINVQFKLIAYVFVMIVELFGLIYVAAYALPFYISNEFRLLALDAVGLIAFFLVRLIIHLVALFQEKHVYLTKNGLITYENNDGGMSDMLHVYIKKDKMPFTAQFDGDIAAAHALTEQYASDKPTA